MKILTVNPYDSFGGAARAAYRIHRSLVDHGATLGVSARMQVYVKDTTDPTVGVSEARPWMRWDERLRLRLMARRLSGFLTGNPVLHSPVLRISGWGEELAATDADLLHLHWVGQSKMHVPTLSVEEIGRLAKPIVWTLHDQWAFRGAEHYGMPPPTEDDRFVVGYHRFNRPAHERGPDINRQTWQRKRRAWRTPLQIVCPSSWMAECVQRSALMRHWPVQVIPCPIDLETFRPFEQAWARHHLGLPQNVPLLLFAADGGTSDRRKGFDLLLQALARHQSDSGHTPLSRIQLVVLGEAPGQEFTSLGVPVHSPGHIESVERLCQYYSAVDAVIIPSRIDNLPNVGLEAHACGTPVVAFRTAGLVDIVADRSTGILAEPFDVDALSQAMSWVLSDPHRPRHLGTQARIRAQSLWAPARIASMYTDLYREVLEREGRGPQP